MNAKNLKNPFFVVSIFFILLCAAHAKANNLENSINFNVDQNFDASARSQVSAILVKTTPSLYFYVEKSWWDSQAMAKQNEVLIDLDNLSSEFSNRIYPVLTSVFGSEWKPGVDGDDKITIFFHSIKEGSEGYFRSADEYIKLQVPDSNEREILYISLKHIDDPQLKVFVGHEFVHLITFNQKDRINGVQEETWLNEARADYTSTILGYDDFYEGSNLQRRVKDFLQNPSDSITEWQENKYDYAVVSLFMHYLVDHYSISILADSVKSKLIGIASINEALAKKGIKENFGQIFVNWTIATVINDCSLDIKYCYLNQNLKNLRINPTLNFLPLSGNSSLSVTNMIKNWSGNWQKIIGGNGDFSLQFSSAPGLNFQVPYIIFNKDNSYSVNFLKLDNNERGQISVQDFGAKYNSIIMMPSLESKTSGFEDVEPSYSYTFTVSIIGSVSQEDQAQIQKLLAKIDALKKQIALLQSHTSPEENLCTTLSHNLYVGLSNDSEVRCLQQFLRNQGQDIYPEGLITGNFGNLTKLAVIRFQERYQAEILLPVGLQSGTGFVGSLTRKKINQLLTSS